MCTANTTIQTVVEKYIALKTVIANMETELDTLESQIKAFMIEHDDADVMVAGSHTVTYKRVMNKRIDTKALKALFGEEALENYFITSETRRFQVK